jgi:hypothetical protein
MLQACYLGLLVGGSNIDVKGVKTIKFSVSWFSFCHCFHNFLSSFRVASDGYMAIYCPIIWPTIQWRGLFCTIFSVSWVVIMRFSKRHGSVLIRIHLPETLYFRMVWNKNLPIGVAFQLCFGLIHEEGTRKQGGNKMNGTRQLLV